MVWAAGTARAARRIATAAALGGGGLTALGATAYGLLIAESLLARKTIGRPHGLDGPPADGVYGDFPGDADQMAMLGDSTLRRARHDRSGQDSGASARPRAGRRSPSARYGSASSASRGRPPPSSASRWTPRWRWSRTVAVLFVGANDVITADPARHRRTASEQSGAAAAGGGRRGDRRHLPRPGHGPAARAAAALGGPALEPPDRRRADGRGGRRGRPYGGVRRPAGAGIPHKPGRNVRTGSFPSICPRLRTGRLRGATFGVRCVGVVARAATRARRRTATDLPRGGDSRGGARHRGRPRPGSPGGPAAPTESGRRCSAGGSGRGSTTPETGHPPRWSRHSSFPFGVDCPCSGLSRNRLSHSPGPWPWPAVPTATQPPPPIRPGTTPRSTPSAGWLRPAEW